MIRKILALQIRTYFVPPERRLVVLDVAYTGIYFKLVGVYAPNEETKHIGYLKRLEVFFIT